MLISKSMALQCINEVAHRHPLFILMIGAPGSGKSSFVDELRDQSAFKVGDSPHLYVHSAETPKTKSLAMQDQVAIWSAISSGMHVVIDRTNITKKNREYWVNMRPDNNHMVVAVDMSGPPLGELVFRIRNRVANGGHHVPELVVEDLLDRYEPPTHQEGFAFVFSVKQE